MSEETKSKNIKPFKLQRGLELMNAAPETYHGLVDELLHEVGVSMLCGKPKTGKSTLLRQLAVCVAEGNIPFFGKPTHCGDVLYLNLEGPKGVVQQHFKKLGLTEKRGVIYFIHQNMPYKGEAGLRQLEATLDVLPNVKLVIVDPVGKLVRLADSDSYDEVTLAVENLEQIAKKYSLHLLFSTHGKKRQGDDVGDSPIGSTGFRGGTDTNIFLGKQGTQRIISTEQRWGIAMDPTLLKFDDKRQEMYLGMTVEAEEEQKQEHSDRKTTERIESDILDFLSAEENPTQGEVLKAVTGKNVKKLKILESLVGSGRIKLDQDGKAMRYSSVALPTEERKAA